MVAEIVKNVTFFGGDRSKLKKNKEKIMVTFFDDIMMMTS